MKSNSSGSRMVRERSAITTNAPLSTPTSRRRATLVVPRDLLAHLHELGLDLVRLDQDLLDVVGVGVHGGRASLPFDLDVRAVATRRGARRRSRAGDPGTRPPGRGRRRSPLGPGEARALEAQRRTTRERDARAQAAQLRARGAHPASRSVVEDGLASLAPRSPSTRRRRVAGDRRCARTSGSRRDPVARSIAGIASRRKALRSRLVSAFVGSRRGRRRSDRQNASISSRRHVEQRTHQLAADRLDPAEPVEPPAADEAHQHRLRVIVHRVAVARAASRRSARPRVPAARDALVASPQLHRVRPAGCSSGAATWQSEPVARRRDAGRTRRRRRVGPEPVIQVEHREPDPEQAAQPHQRSRADTPNRARPRPRRGPGRRARTGRARERSRDALEHPRDRRRPARRAPLPRDAGDPAIRVGDLAGLRQVLARCPDEVEAAHARSDRRPRARSARRCRTAPPSDRTRSRAAAASRRRGPAAAVASAA